MRKQKERNSIVIIVAYVVLGIISFMCIAPVVLMAVASFTDNDVLNLYGYTYFPQKWSLEAYEFLIKQGTVISKFNFSYFYGDCFRDNGNRTFGIYHFT